MTPEERYAKIDARLDAIAMHLELTASMAHANEEKLEKARGGTGRGNRDGRDRPVRYHDKFHRCTVCEATLAATPLKVATPLNDLREA